MCSAPASVRREFGRPLSCGVAALSDAETLEALLCRALRGRAGETAERLLQRFGSLQAVLTADVALLTSLVSPRVAQDLRLVHEAACRLAAAELPRRSVLSSWSALMAYLKLGMGHMTREALR